MVTFDESTLVDLVGLHLPPQSLPRFPGSHWSGIGVVNLDWALLPECSYFLKVLSKCLPPPDQSGWC